MARTVYLHVGSPLVPATPVREVLARHRRRLARAGVLYPASHLGHEGGHHSAVLDVLSLTAGEHAPSPGAWDRLAETVRDWRRGTAVVSHELLATATEAQVDRIVASLGSAEVHVVLVAQDLGRQVPRAWQQWVHGGGTAPFTSYAGHVARREPHRTSRVFWRSHDVAEVLARWAGQVPPERVHVVTAAHGEGADEVTWTRFARTLGVDPARFPTDGVAPQSLTSLVGTEVVRLLQHGAGPLSPARLDEVRRAGGSVAGAPPLVPADLRDALAAEAELTLKRVRAEGWDLVGDADDLLPRDDAFTATAAEATPPPADVLRAQTEVLRALCAAPGTDRGPAGVRRRALRVWDRVRP